MILPSITQEPLEEVLGKYDLKVSSLKSENYKEKKGVWWVQTASGKKILKKVSNSDSTLRYILAAVKHLAANGVHIPAVIQTCENQDYVNIDGVCYVLWEAIEGRNPKYSTPQELAGIVTELAKFHRAAAGFKPPADSKPKIHLGLWVQEYSRQVENMRTFYQEEQASGSNRAIAKTVVAEFPVFYERAQKAVAGLQGKEYAQWVEKSAKSGCLCHQDFAAGNLLLTAGGKIYVLDTDSITIDIPARDLRKLLNKVMKKNGKWDQGLTKIMLAAYQAVNPLTPSEWQVVKLDLTYPHLFLGAMSKYYYRRETEWTEEKYHQRLKEMSAVEKSIKPVLDNFDSLIPLVGDIS